MFQTVNCDTSQLTLCITSRQTWLYSAHPLKENNLNKISVDYKHVKMKYLYFTTGCPVKLSTL